MILLVVNHEPTQDALAPLIKARGYEVLPAECGDEALHCVRTFRPRLIILDCGLPDSFEILESVRKQRPGHDIPIVMFSVDEPHVKERALSSGADGFVAKESLDWVHLLDEIIRFVGPPM